MTSRKKKEPIRFPGQCVHAVVRDVKGIRWSVKCDLRHRIKNKDLIQCRFYECGD